MQIMLSRAVNFIARQVVEPSSPGRGIRRCWTLQVKLVRIASDQFVRLASVAVEMDLARM
jgi:hypothetical protein